MLKSFFKAVMPIAAIGMATTLSGCDGADMKINGEEGVPLAALDMTGEVPTGVMLAGPDSVIITDGDELTIDVEGEQEAVDAVRFVISDGMLAIMREKDNWDGSETATIRVTVPKLEDIAIGGSGTADAQSLSGDASISIGGSGKVSVAQISGDGLDVNVGGSGDVVGAGSTGQLDLNIGGAGNVDLSAVTVGNADINIGGSGDVKFASDGNVDANIVGSGDIVVTGNATCEMNAIGSGTLTCEAPAADASDDTDSES